MGTADCDMIFFACSVHVAQGFSCQIKCMMLVQQCGFTYTEHRLRRLHTVVYLREASQAGTITDKTACSLFGSKH